MTSQTIILRSPTQRARAVVVIQSAPDNTVVEIREAKRSLDQNAKMWAMLADVSRSEPEGRKLIADEWKCIFMHACGWEVQFLDGLDGRPFPVGFSSSKLTVRQMADLITFIYAYGDQHGVQWSEPHPDEFRQPAGDPGPPNGSSCSDMKRAGGG